MKNDFSFAPLKDAERKRLEKEEKEIKEKASNAQDALIACLKSGTFAKYREEYKKAESALIETGIKLDLVNPVEYAMAAKTIFINLKVLRQLNDQIDADQKRVLK